MRLANTFSGSGKPRKPKPNQFEIFVEGRKGPLTPLPERTDATLAAKEPLPRRR